MEQIQLLSLFATLLVCGAPGYWMAGKLKRPVSNATVIIVIVATALAVYVGISVMLISIFGFTIYLNWALSAFGLGMVANLLIRKKCPVQH